MLRIIIPESEDYNESTNEFIKISSAEILLEHSLLSISKWESLWHKPFLEKNDKTNEETLSYIKCMTISKNVSDLVYRHLTSDNIKAIINYIDDSHTATWFNERKSKSGKKEVVTSELIYYWMIAYNIPFECQKWHLNRLLTLIRICSLKNETPKKMSKRETAMSNSKLNAQRRKMLNTKG